MLNQVLCGLKIIIVTLERMVMIITSNGLVEVIVTLSVVMEIGLSLI